jgi:hypothetical protein
MERRGGESGPSLALSACVAALDPSRTTP